MTVVGVTADGRGNWNGGRGSTEPCRDHDLGGLVSRQDDHGPGLLVRWPIGRAGREDQEQAAGRPGKVLHPRER